MKLLILDRDGVINLNSKDPTTDYYYILKPEHLILKDGVAEAFVLIQELINASKDELKVVLATRQKCISKGLITREDVEQVNNHMCGMLGFRFNQMYIQESGDNKADTFQKILSDYNIDPTDVVLIDDSSSEREAANALGISAIWEGNDGREANLLDSLKNYKAKV